MSPLLSSSPWPPESTGEDTWVWEVLISRSRRKWGCLEIGARECTGKEKQPRVLELFIPTGKKHSEPSLLPSKPPPHAREKAKLVGVRWEARSPSPPPHPTPAAGCCSPRHWSIIQKQGSLLSWAPEDLVRSQPGGLGFSGPLLSLEAVDSAWKS